jgi:hypothetical protein
MENLLLPIIYALVGLFVITVLIMWAVYSSKVEKLLRENKKLREEKRDLTMQNDVLWNELDKAHKEYKDHMDKLASFTKKWTEENGAK